MEAVCYTFVPKPSSFPGGVDSIWVSQLTSPCLKFLHLLSRSLQTFIGLRNYEALPLLDVSKEMRRDLNNK